MFDRYVYLYVEDDSLSREIMRVIMHGAMGVSNLHIFENSANFLERIRSLPQKPDLIMLDIHVKPIDGFAMLELLRGDAQYQTSKIIALTASVMDDEVDRLRSNGFDGAIGKPLNIQDFPGLVKRILGGEAVWHIA